MASAPTTKRAIADRIDNAYNRACRSSPADSAPLMRAPLEWLNDEYHTHSSSPMRAVGSSTRSSISG